MKASEIARTMGGRKTGGGYVMRCPVHSDREPSLSVTQGDGGRLLVHCFAGCDARDVFKELRHLGLLDGHWSRNSLDQTNFSREQEPRHRDDAFRTSKALKIWAGAGTATGTIVEKYLSSRAITPPPPASIRFHPKCYHPSGIFLPAMIALVEQTGIGPVAVHATYLLSDGSGKALVKPDKAMFGPVGGAAVRLAEPRPDEWLGVAEGIETALSVMIATGLSSWAALSAGGLKSLILPPGIKLVVIAADHDANGCGQRAAYAAAQRWISEGRRVRVCLPPSSGSDWNDVLRGKSRVDLLENEHAA